MCAIDVALNEKREEITRLEDEIRADEPAVLQMSLDELRSLNDHLAEDLRILVDKFPPPTSSPKAMDRKELNTCSGSGGFGNNSILSGNQIFPKL